MIKIILSTIITLSILTSTADTGYMNDLLPTHKIPAYREVLAEVTAYTASIDECNKDDGITASGVKAVEGIQLPLMILHLVQKLRLMVSDWLSKTDLAVTTEIESIYIWMMFPAH